MRAPNLVVMGVAGCGKSSVGLALAEALGAVWLEGDAFHPPANIARMSAGIPLDDDDRAGWLAALADRLAAGRARGERMVLGCSALKRRYRDRLRLGDPDLVFVHLAGSRALIGERMAARPGHFMPPSLLDSQFAALEPPRGDEPHFTASVTAAPEAIRDAVLGWLAAGMPAGAAVLSPPATDAAPLPTDGRASAPAATPAR
ncbi:gluconokinase, GntK/IdnK-type [Derxia gummosa]|uniref:Gluconokinase n=1 Tax=Derxia gummosa DSM 723 TaxID=1121388 RepID=A0ABD8F602_9BURK